MSLLFASTTFFVRHYRRYARVSETVSLAGFVENRSSYCYSLRTSWPDRRWKVLVKLFWRQRRLFYNFFEVNAQDMGRCVSIGWGELHIKRYHKLRRILWLWKGRFSATSSVRATLSLPWFFACCAMAKAPNRSRQKLVHFGSGSFHWRRCFQEMWNFT